MREAMSFLAEDGIDVRFLSVPYLSPRFDLQDAVEAAERVIVVECNATGQFADLVEHDTLTRVERITKYNGVRFNADELAEAVRDTLAESQEVAA
jgi:2-oxoglutarate ferredoxin oxidoreductase subunit alpha